MTYEYALVPVNAVTAARVPLPMNQTPAERAAYLADLTAADLETSEQWPLSVSADTDAPETGEEIDP